MLVIGARHLSYLADIRWALPVQTLAAQRAMEALDEGVLIWSLGRTNIDGDPQTLPETDKGALEVAPTHRSHPPGVAVKTNHIWQAVLSQRSDDGCKDGLGRVVLTWLNGEGHRGAGVHDVERFYHVLLLAVRVGGDTGGVFKVELKGTSAVLGARRVPLFSALAERMRPQAHRIVQIVRVERGRRSPWASNPSSRWR